jgi:hypothetical protein
VIKLRGGDSAGPKGEPQGFQNLPNHRSFFRSAKIFQKSAKIVDRHFAIYIRFSENQFLFDYGLLFGILTTKDRNGCPKVEFSPAPYIRIEAPANIHFI